jgi:single-strand DNA-binding protein
MSLNKEISLTGNVGRVDSQYTDSGKFIFKFSLAVTVGKGENKETEWYECVSWEKQGELLNQYVGVGSRIQVRGDFKLDTWLSKDKQEPKAKIVVTVKDFQFLSNKKEASETPYDEPA